MIVAVIDCEQSLYHGKNAKQVSVRACVTCERQCREPLEMWALEDAKRETSLVSYSDLDATLTGRINDTSTLF